MSTNKLEQLIRQHVSLSTHANLNGWHAVLCKVCNDRGHKGDRAAFKFGDTTGYNCFNCGIKAAYDSSKDEEFSESMKRVLKAFNIAESDWGAVLYDAMSNQYNGIGVKDTIAALLVEMNPPVLDMPDFFYKLTDDPTDEWAQYAIDYLTTQRGVSWKSYPFMLAKVTNHPSSKKWYGRLILPIYKDNKLIFYQGRDLGGTRIKKYESPSSPKEAVMYGYDHIYDKPRDLPLYIVEGWFDAHHINGVAVLGNRLTKQQIYWLNKSPRPKVVIPDRMGQGRVLADAGLKLGWSVAMPDIANCKDIDEAVVKYGLIYVLNSIREHTYNGFEATSMLGIYCE